MDFCHSQGLDSLAGYTTHHRCYKTLAKVNFIWWQDLEKKTCRAHDKAIAGHVPSGSNQTGRLSPTFSVSHRVLQACSQICCLMNTFCSQIRLAAVIAATVKCNKSNNPTPGGNFFFCHSKKYMLDLSYQNWRRRGRRSFLQPHFKYRKINKAKLLN